MAGISDSKNVDDTILHLGIILEADAKRAVAPEAETEDAKDWREAAILPAGLRAQCEALVAELQGQSPALTAAESAKLLDSRAGREALAAGRSTLGRVDDHLFAVTGEREPEVGTRYGVRGENPQTFGGVYRALALSRAEDDRIRALPASDPSREFLFSRAVRGELDRSFAALDAVLRARLGSRAELSVRTAARGETMVAAQSVITKVRQWLYANLPDRKQDDALRAYGFRPVEPSSGPRKKDDPEAPPAVGGPPASPA